MALQSLNLSYHFSILFYQLLVWTNSIAGKKPKIVNYFKHWPNIMALSLFVRGITKETFLSFLCTDIKTMKRSEIKNFKPKLWTKNIMKSEGNLPVDDAMPERLPQARLTMTVESLGLNQKDQWEYYNQMHQQSMTTIEQLCPFLSIPFILFIYFFLKIKSYQVTYEKMRFSPMRLPIRS